MWLVRLLHLGNLQHVRQGRAPVVVKRINLSSMLQEQLHQAMLHVPRGFVQRGSPLNVCLVYVRPVLQQETAHLEVALLLIVGVVAGLTAGGAECCFPRAVLVVHLGTVAQVQLDVLVQALSGCHLQGRLILLTKGVDLGTMTHQEFGTATMTGVALAPAFILGHMMGDYGKDSNKWNRGDPNCGICFDC